MSWKITSSAQDQNQLLVDESLFSQGNGYLGVRGNFEEGYPSDMKSIRGTYINAFHDIVPIEYGEKLFGFPDTQQKLVNVMDTQSIQVFLDGEAFSLFTGDVLEYKRHLHMDEGYAERIVHWRSPAGKEAKITFKRLISFVHKELFIQWIDIEPLSEIGEIHLESIIDGGVTNYVDADDPRVASGHAKRLHVKDVFTEGDVSGVVDETEVSKLQAAAAVTLRVAGSIEERRSDRHPESVFETLSFPGDQPVKVEKWTVFTDTYRHGDHVKEKAVALLKDLEEKSIHHILDDQRTYLDRFWKTADIQISGDDQLQEGIRFNLYQLLQSVGKDPKSNIAAKGLSGEGYEGHYFWDTEIYMYPPFLMTDPAIAKNLLLHRFSLLDAARGRAKEMGHQKGALFPWRTITGGECSAFFPAGSAQYHISADIAYSFIHYYLTTADKSFLASYGAELLVETARLWMDTGHFKNDQFRIDDVTGPDEYTCIVNNNYYTNSMAKYNLDWAVKAMNIVLENDPKSYDALVNKLGLDIQELDQFKEAAIKMYYPYDEQLGIHAQDDTFLNKQIWNLEKTPKEEFPLLLHYHPLTLYRYQVCKQADTVLSYYLLEDEADEEIIRRSYNYYEKVTTHDSSLSYCVFSIMASKLGYEEKAYRYFIETARLDLDNTHKNTKDGLHMANMGGTWLALVSGFGGMRVKETGLHFAPRLPKEWDELRFHIRYQDRLIAIDMTTDQTEYTLLEGEPLHFLHHGEELELIKTLTI